MKVRIITNGKRYRIERKTLFGWKLLTRVYGYYLATIVSPIEFKTHNEAVRYLREEYGKTVDIVDWWNPVGVL